MVPSPESPPNFKGRPHLSQSTIRSYETALLPLLQQRGYTPIDRLARPELEQYLNTLPSTGAN